MEALPGMTRYREDGSRASSTDLVPFTQFQSTKSLIQREIILLATSVITEETLFHNGLFQNVYLLYRMFEAMGYLTILFTNKKVDDTMKIPKFMSDVRMLSADDFHKSPVPVKAYIEIGMSIDEPMRRFLKMCGAKVCKLYLGNILNIDTETPIFYPQMHFAHHVIGSLDKIWVSPHYTMPSEYALALNHMPLDKAAESVVPYIWDPQVLTAGGERNFQWRPAASPAEDVFLILEPNISFQKCSLIPLMMIEAWFRKNPDWKGEVVLVNGDRLMMMEFFKKNIYNTLELVKAGRVKITQRLDILTLLKTYPSAIPICHQWNNEYNYMVLEYFHCGYPVLHNATDWKGYGYYYEHSNIESAVNQIDLVRSSHKENFHLFLSHAKTLTWRHSPYNPDVQRAWEKTLRLI